MIHDPNCEDVTGAYPGSCTCAVVGGNRIPASYLKRFLPSQGKPARPDIPYELRLFLENLK
jgi:hypothetical protein